MSTLHCDYQANQKDRLKIHIESKHDKIEYPCQHCEHKVSTKRRLKLHIQAIHEKISYPCDKCEYKATTKQNPNVTLRQNMKIRGTLVTSVNVKQQKNII